MMKEGQQQQENVSGWYNVESVPADYIFPAEERPWQLPIPLCNTVPVVDLHMAKTTTTTPEKSTIIQKIIKACEEYGFFQVINHGVSENVVRDTLGVYRDFFNLPEEDRKCGGGGGGGRGEVNSSDGGEWIYWCSTDFAKDGVHLWRESIKHSCHPLQECMQRWPPKPARYREVVATYLKEMRKLSGRILELISEGLGMEQGYLREMSQVQHMVCNYYPPCPDPSLTLGLLRHCDPSLITILLQQGNACGLQVLNHGNGQWMGVSPLPNALVVNIGNQLEIISNGKLKSPEHRAVNSKEERASIAVFINPPPNSIVEPAKALVDELNPPRFPPALYKDYVNTSKAYIRPIPTST